MKCTTHTHDPVLKLVYPPEKTIEYFGEDFLEEYGIEIPDDLAKRAIESYENMLVVQDELDEFLEHFLNNPR